MIGPVGHRDEALRERMEDPGCDPVRLRRTYAQFGAVNRVLAGWGRVWSRHLRPRLGPDATLLDIGCGGGDVARRLVALAARDAVRLRVTGIDPDARALSFASSAGADGSVRFERASAAELVRRGERFDAVISNHVLHHLASGEVGEFLAISRALARGPVIHNDIRRSGAALLAFGVFALPFRGSFVREDGLRSVRRSFTVAELRAVADGFVVERLEPFRLLVVARP